MNARRGFARALERAWWQPRPGPLAWLLWPLSLVYRALAALHRACTTPQAVGRPVIVVGNLVVGGAGKTPTVIALLRLLRERGWTPGVVSRGYGRRTQGLREAGPQTTAADLGDEPLLIHRRAGVPVLVGRDRVAAARALCRAHPEVDIVVSDDGLQHHRLARAVEVLVFDERGVGNGLCLPAGPLREPPPPAPPARAVVLYNASAASTALSGHLATRRLGDVLPLADWQAGRTAPPGDGWAALRGRRVLAVAGIAAPQRFFAMLRAQGLDFDTLALPDHHAFDRLPWPDDPTLHVVLTEKDAVKLPLTSNSKAPVWVAPLDFEPDAGFAAALDRLLPHPAPR